MLGKTPKLQETSPVNSFLRCRLTALKLKHSLLSWRLFLQLTVWMPGWLNTFSCKPTTNPGGSLFSWDVNYGTGQHQQCIYTYHSPSTPKIYESTTSLPPKKLPPQVTKTPLHSTVPSTSPRTVLVVHGTTDWLVGVVLCILFNSFWGGWLVELIGLGWCWNKIRLLVYDKMSKKTNKCFKFANALFFGCEMSWESILHFPDAQENLSKEFDIYL